MDSSDPYCWPDSDCLRNKLNIYDGEELSIVEARIVAIRDVELARETVPGEYDLDHLKLFHFGLFRDVYEWAGRTRTVDISKGFQFAHWRFVDDECARVLSGLTADGYLLGLAREVAPQGIRVAAVRPGVIETEFHARAGGAPRRERGALIG